MWVWNRFVNRACFHVNGIKRYHWLAIQGIRQCHPCWKCFSKNLIHVPNIWTPTLASYSCGLIQISLTDNDLRMVWDLTSFIYVWHLFLAMTISGFILEVVTKESFLFLLWHSSKKKKKKKNPKPHTKTSKPKPEREGPRCPPALREARPAAVRRTLRIGAGWFPLRTLRPPWRT